MLDPASNSFPSNTPPVGLLALQGAFHAHARVFASIGASTRQVRTADDLADCSHLVIPGGESTTLLKLLEFRDLTAPILKHAADGKPVLATCAGLILLACEVRNPPQDSLGLLDAVVQRNAYGSQVDSFQADLDIPTLGPAPFPGVFIRAPIIISTGETVVVLASLNGHPVFVRRDNILATTFHPELSDDARIHKLFLSL